MWGMATSQSLHAPKRFASSASFTRSRSASAPLWPASFEMPALLTSTSSLPWSRSTEAASFSTLAGSETSSWWGITSPGSFPAASRPAPSSREPRITVSPSAASWRQTSSPIPLFPPLTSATRPFPAIRPPYFRACRREILHTEQPERRPDRLPRRGRRGDVPAEVPTPERDHGPPDLERQPYLGERAVLAPHGDDHVPGTDHRKVPRVAHARGKGVGQVPV